MYPCFTSVERGTVSLGYDIWDKACIRLQSSGFGLETLVSIFADSLKQVVFNVIIILIDV